MFMKTRFFAIILVLVLVVSAVVRRNAAALMSGEVVRLGFDQLRQAFPVLCAEAEDRLGAGLLAGVLRALLAEEISVRNLAVILEAMLMAPPRLENCTRGLWLPSRPSEKSGASMKPDPVSLN